MERLTHEADFGLEDWEETLFLVKSDPNGAYDILDIARYSGEPEFDEILKSIALRLAAYENTGLTPEEVQQMRWVPVEERLPDKPGHYLVCTSVNYWHGGCMDKNGVSSNTGTTDGYVGTTLSVLDCFYDTTGDWNRVCNKHVTHWMNIPAPPGAVAKNETTESNEPLTPEELRKMLGEPVWTVGVTCTNDGKWAMWDIVEKADNEGVDFGYSTEGREWWNYNLRGNNGKLLNCAWACYRRPPEGEEETP